MRESFSRLRRPRKVLGPFWLAADTHLFGAGHSANAEERQAPRGEGRSDAGEDIGARRSCPYVESSLQKSVGGNGPEKRGSQRFKGEARERGSSPRMTILARKHTRIARPCTHQRKPRGAASVTGEAGGDTKPESGSVTLQTSRVWSGFSIGDL